MSSSISKGDNCYLHFISRSSIIIYFLCTLLSYMFELLEIKGHTTFIHVVYCRCFIQQSVVGQCFFKQVEVMFLAL